MKLMSKCAIKSLKANDVSLENLVCLSATCIQFRSKNLALSNSRCLRLQKFWHKCPCRVHVTQDWRRTRLCLISLFDKPAEFCTFNWRKLVRHASLDFLSRMFFSDIVSVHAIAQSVQYIHMQRGNSVCWRCRDILRVIPWEPIRKDSNS